MQDNFLFNKLQGGSSLFMKSDHDGSVDEYHKGVPLGIKTVAQGINNFTEWEGISDKLEQHRLANLEDIHPNSLKFVSTGTHAFPRQALASGKWWTYPGSHGAAYSYLDMSFEDSWSANKVKVYDDMAFVAYDMYTDLHRVDIELDDIEFRQHHFTEYLNINYDMVITRADTVGTLAGSTSKLPVFDKVSATANSFEDYRNINSSIDFAVYQNSILKVEFSGTINRGQDNVSGQYKQNIPKVAYFMYGGALGNDREDVGVSLNTNTMRYENLSGHDNKRMILSNGFPNPNTNFKFPNPVFNDKNVLDLNILKDQMLKDEEAVVGLFFLVVNEYDDDSIHAGGRAESDRVDKNNGVIGIQLSLQCNWGNNEGSPDNLRDVYPYTAFGPTPQGEALYFQTVDTTKVTLIKIQPVRQCGKVDIYTKKRGIVSSVVNHLVTSPGHGLHTNDVIEITGALFDGSEVTYADIHYMNGVKYVKVITDDTFEIYDDEFFEDPVNTSNLRTTDGISWVGSSNNFGAIGQSWDYYGTVVSPTGRNGYKFVDPNATDVKDSLSATDEFFTTKRAIRLDDPTSSDENEASITLDFHATRSSRQLDFFNSDFGKRVDERIPVCFEGNYDTPLNDPKRGHYDFFPFVPPPDPTKIAVGDSIKPPYLGCRFGCDLDIKFSHMSGASKVYTLAVGEQGADSSVDIFGVDDREFAFGSVPYAKVRKWQGPGGSDVLVGSFGRRVLPWYMPHGKTHLLKITVDQYGRISDISHADTIFGGGTAITDNEVFDSYQEPRPWLQLEKTYARPEYRKLCREPLTNTAIVPDPLYVTEDSIVNSEAASFDRTWNPQNRTKYWVRSAAVHWVGQTIKTYKKSTSGTTVNLRAMDIDRRTLAINSDGVNNRSRFGSAGFGGPFVPYERIDRWDHYGLDDDRGRQYRYIYPWVDSFGKSVAIQNFTGLATIPPYLDSDPKTVVLSASSSLSNAESYYSPNDHEPVFGTSTSLKQADTVPEIGQIQADFIYSDGSTYQHQDHIYLNAGGADCGRDFSNMTRKSDGFRKLKTGHNAGDGMPEAIISCKLSALCLEWIGDEIIWVDQRIKSAKSTVTILKFNDGFTLQTTFSQPFIDPRFYFPSTLQVPDARNTGDGFGVCFAYDGDTFVTNGRSKTTELDINVADYLTLGKDRMDFLHVYENHKGGFVPIQKISATIDRIDESKYPLHLTHSYPDLVDMSGTVSYNNTSINNRTWNIDFEGRYDLVNGKIIVKDPLEYSLFGRNFSVSDATVATTSSASEVEMYLGLMERAKTSTLRSNNSLTYSYISPETLEYDCRDIGGPLNASVSSKTPFFFYKLPVKNLDLMEDLVIKFDMNDEDIYSLFELHGTVEDIDGPNNIIPRVVLYGRDPRMTVIENGPANSGTRNSLPKYENGIWKELDTIYDDPTYDIFSHDFPGWYRGGAQDLFFYGRLPGSIVRQDGSSISGTDQYLYGGETNLGEYYDSTVGSRLSGAAGDPAWVAPDIYRSLSASQESKVIPYAKIFLPTASVDGYSVTIPRDTLKNFVIQGSLLKDSDRPTSLVTGFDDSSNAIVGVDNIDYSIVIGFLLTNINSFDINTAVITHEEPASFNVGPLRYILDIGSDDEYVNARYPYSHALGYYAPSPDGNKYNGVRLEYDLRTKIKNISVSLSKKKATQRRYSCKFSKIATFDYVQDPRQDVVESYRTRRSATARETNVFKSFGYDKFVPVPVHPSKNPIISIAKHSTEFSYPNEREIISIENIHFDDSSYYVDPDTGNLEYNTPPTGNIIGLSNFNSSSFMGGFDLDEDQYVSLFIRSNATKTRNLRLFTEGSNLSSNVCEPSYLMVSDTEFLSLDGSRLDVLGSECIPLGHRTLFMNGIGGDDNSTSLWTGTRDRKKGMNLFLKYQVQDRPMSLFIYEPQPSSVAPLNMRAPDYVTSMELVFGSTPTGNPPLYLQAPVPVTTGIPLVMAAADSGNIPLFVGGIGKPSTGTTLFMSGIAHDNNGISLTFSPGVSGNMPLFLARNLTDSGNMPLVMTDPFEVYNSGITLWIARNNIEHDMDLYIKPQRYSNDNTSLFVDTEVPINLDTSLFIDGPVSTNEDLNLYVRSIFPSGEMDLYVSPIEYSGSGIPLSIGTPVEDNSMTLHMERMLNPAIPLYIGGKPIPYPVVVGDGAESLYINSSYDINDINLVMPTIDYDSGNFTLFAEGGTGNGLNVKTPLFIGKEINANNLADLYISNDKFASCPPELLLVAKDEKLLLNGNDFLTLRDPTCNPVGGGISLLVNGTLSASNFGSGPLYIEVPPSKSENFSGDLFIKVKEPLYGPGGGILESGILPLFIDANNDAGVYFKRRKGSILYMSSWPIDSGVAPLFINRPYGGLAPLYVHSLLDSGNITMNVSGANIGTGSINLFVSPPEGSGMNIFTRGYLE